ncbi:MAG: hypothetical protein ABSF09_05615 [Candidatus Bathyarchaeia archaeon]
MVNYESVAIEMVTLALTLGLLVYAIRIHLIFKGSNSIGRTTPLFAAAAFFLLLGSVLRSALLWGYLTEFEPLQITCRTVGILLLFTFAYSFARIWIKLGK